MYIYIYILALTRQYTLTNVMWIRCKRLALVAQLNRTGTFRQQVRTSKTAVCSEIGYLCCTCPHMEGLDSQETCAEESVTYGVPVEKCRLWTAMTSLLCSSIGQLLLYLLCDGGLGQPG